MLSLEYDVAVAIDYRSEANDLAMRIAKAATRQKDVICLEA